MEWTAAETFLALLDGEARCLLFALLRAPSEERAAAIGYAYAHPDGATAAELLILIEERDWARRWLLERLVEDAPLSDDEHALDHAGPLPNLGETDRETPAVE